MTADKKTRRLLLGATCYADARESIDIAALLARKLNLDISAYLLEDEATLLASDLPHAKVTNPSGTTLPVSASEMRDAFHRDAQAFQQALSIKAKRSRLDWTFTQIAGTFESVLDEEGGRKSLSLFGYNRLHQPPSGTKSLIVVAFEGKELDPSVDQLALALAEETGGQIETIALDVQFDQSQLIAFLQGQNLAALIISDPLVRKIGVDTVINAGRCPVVIIGTNQRVA